VLKVYSSLHPGCNISFLYRLLPNQVLHVCGLFDMASAYITWKETRSSEINVNYTFYIIYIHL